VGGDSLTEVGGSSLTAMVHTPRGKLQRGGSEILSWNLPWYPWRG